MRKALAICILALLTVLPTWAAPEGTTGAMALVDETMLMIAWFDQADTTHGDGQLCNMARKVIGPNYTFMTMGIVNRGHWHVFKGNNGIATLTMADGREVTSIDPVDNPVTGTQFRKWAKRKCRVPYTTVDGTKTRLWSKEELFSPYAIARPGEFVVVFLTFPGQFTWKDITGVRFNIEYWSASPALASELKTYLAMFIAL